VPSMIDGGESFGQYKRSTRELVSSLSLYKRTAPGTVTDHELPIQVAALGRSKSKEDRKRLYIHHRRLYFLICESHKLGVHEQSAGVRAYLWLHISALLL
jgi:hypothetical protein